MTDPLDLLLNSSAPDTADPDLSDEFAAMVAAARLEVRPVRRLPRYVATGALVGILLGGAGAAAAVTLGDWSPWAQHPDYSYTYTLPSGVRCEARLGNVSGSDAELVGAMKEYLASVDVLEIADVDAAIAVLRAREEFADADAEYQLAVDMAVTTVLFEEMERQGFAFDGGFESLQTEWDCES